MFSQTENVAAGSCCRFPSEMMGEETFLNQLEPFKKKLFNYARRSLYHSVNAEDVLARSGRIQRRPETGVIRTE